MAIVTCGDGPCTTEVKNSGAACANPVRTYEGAVLAKYERNGYDDSDFCAIVWDADAGEIRHVEYASTRGWSYHNGATVDATEAVQAAAEAHLAQLLTRILTAAAERDAAKVERGRLVRSITKRGKNVGAQGVVEWFGEDAYGSNRWTTRYRVGIRVPGETSLRFMSAESVEVIDAQPVDVAEIRQQATARATQRQWRLAV